MTAFKHILIVVVIALIGAVLASVFGMLMFGAVIAFYEDGSLLSMAWGMLLLTPIATVIVSPVALGAAITLSVLKSIIEPYQTKTIGVCVGAVWGTVGAFLIYWFLGGELSILSSLILSLIAGVATGAGCAILHSKLWGKMF